VVAAAAELLEPAPVAVAAALTPQDGPLGAVGVAVAVPNWSRESPGSGNARSWESAVTQEVVGMLATNMSGKALNAVVSRSISMV